MNRPLKAWSLGTVPTRMVRVALSLLAAAIWFTSARADAAEGRPCGGLQGLQCGSGEYCDFPEQAQCGAADQTGTCKVKPKACTFIYQPVCGCDDQTYSNACAANAAGVSVASQGECGAECKRDEDCPHGACEGGVTCAGLNCPPPPPPACTVCGDGTALACKSLPRPCPDGQVREIVNGCYGECVDRHTCEDAPPAKQCKYDGKVYYPGENFPATDGCNRCSCDASGKVMCTLKLCTPPTKCDYRNPNRRWVAKDPEQCKLVRFVCESGSQYFGNECGCGCEKSPTPPPKPGPRCVVGGCSGQLCTDAARGGVASTCEWRSEYACYRGATCAAQADGRCGWTQTPQLRACLGGAR